MGFLWDVAPCSLVGIDRRFRLAFCFQVNDNPIGRNAFK
jgi:hypothetical protein